MKLREKKELSEMNGELGTLSASERVRWVLDQFGDKTVMSSSFGIQSSIMLHLVTQIRPEIPVIFIDTGYLFPETYRYAEELVDRLKLNVKVYVPVHSASWQEAIYGRRWEKGKRELKAYGMMNKLEPMNRALKEHQTEAWLTGLRHEQSTTREDLNYLTLQQKIHKAHPILDWSSKDVYYYMQKHDLPSHPLWEKGYVSVGDWHSSAPLTPGMTEEQTRFSGIKRECGRFD